MLKITIEEYFFDLHTELACITEKCPHKLFIESVCELFFN